MARLLKGTARKGVVVTGDYGDPAIPFTHVLLGEAAEDLSYDDRVAVRMEGGPFTADPIYEATVVGMVLEVRDDPLAEDHDEY